MIITDNIDSPISISDEGLQIYIDFDKPDVEKGRGNYRYPIYFQNVVNGEVLDTKAARVIFQPISVNNDDKFNFTSLEALFRANNQFLRNYLVDTPFDWI